MLFLFQFLNGAIKSHDTGLLAPTVDDFNSSMVRLKDGDHQFGKIIIQFQFLNGAIKRCTTTNAGGDQASFNSSMVRLKDSPFAETGPLARSFNSSMVRLKVTQNVFGVTLVVRFQFLDGAIKSTIAIVFVGRELRFNSSMVRLKVQGNALPG